MIYIKLDPYQMYVWVKDLAMRWRKRETKRRVQHLQQKKRSRDEDGEVQDLAVLERIKRAAESNEKRAARLKQQEICIPQWPELAIIVII